MKEEMGIGNEQEGTLPVPVMLKHIAIVSDQVEAFESSSFVINTLLFSRPLKNLY